VSCKSRYSGAKPPSRVKSRSSESEEMSHG
jgi:hypothetical protein